MPLTGPSESTERRRSVCQPSGVRFLLRGRRADVVDWTHSMPGLHFSPLRPCIVYIYTRQALIFLSLSLCPLAVPSSSSDAVMGSRFSAGLLLLLLAVVSLNSGVAPAEGAAGNLCGRSPPEESCNINCLVPDPVCGANGVTYTCGCVEADCNGVRVVKLGEC